MQVRSKIVSIGTKRGHELERFYKIFHGKGGDLNRKLGVDGQKVFQA